MDAAIYTRISADRAGAGLGVERQEADCRDLATRLGWTVVAVHTDNDLSAYSGAPRPGYRALLADLETGRVGAVIAWHVDRLHRRVAELEEFVAICESRGVAVQTCRAGSLDLTTASGRMVARMLGAASQHEVDHARERMKRAKAQAAAEGRYRGGPRPFGYETDGVTVRQPEADALLTAARGLVAGRSLNALAREMRAAGITTATGAQMDATALRRILRRPRNAGLMEHQGETVGRAAWPAIIPEDIWRAVVAVLDDPSRRTTTGPERRWLGAGLYRCGVCGERLFVTTTGGRLSYRCPTATKRRNSAAPVTHVARSQPPVDEFVRESIRHVLSAPGLVARLTRAEDDPESMDALGRIEAVRARLAVFEADYAAGHITGRQLAEATARVDAEVRDLSRLIAARSRSSALRGVAVASDPAAMFESASLDVQRAILDALAVVTIHPGRRGRPVGWKPGQPYADLHSVDISWLAGPPAASGPVDD